MTFGIAVVSIIVIVVFAHIFEMRNFRRKLRMRFSQEYGQKPNMDTPLSDYKETALYYNLIKDQIPDDEKLDEVTWEDLEMIQIFRRINTTVSYAGEQLLFAWLHRLPKDKTSLVRRENIISRNISFLWPERIFFYYTINVLSRLFFKMLFEF